MTEARKRRQAVRSYKVCRNCRHVEVVDAPVGDYVKQIHLCGGRPGRRRRVVSHNGQCDCFRPRTIPAPEPPDGFDGPGGKAYLIPLSRGMFAMVDERDYAEMAQYRWSAWSSPLSRTYYAMRSRGGGSMHRAIMKPPAGMQVDHINHNGLDNRRANLRICTLSQNVANQRPRGATSRYKGVCRDRSSWHAKIRLRGKMTHLGNFKNEEEAARAYDAAARREHGEFAYLNFPDESCPVKEQDRNSSPALETPVEDAQAGKA